MQILNQSTLKPESSKRSSRVLDRRVKLRGFIHITCSYIHVNCYMIDIMWYAMSVLAGPRLRISACVEDSAGKHISDA